MPILLVPAARRRRLVLGPVLWAIASVFTAACNNPTSPTGTPGGLAIGDEISPAGNNVLFITFLAVVEDTRCPTRVQCITEGDAVVRFGYRMGLGPTVPFILRLNTAPRDTVIAQYRVVFDSLTPRAELPNVIIPPSSYRAWISFRSVP